PSRGEWAGGFDGRRRRKCLRHDVWLQRPGLTGVPDARFAVDRSGAALRGLRAANQAQAARPLKAKWDHLLRLAGSLGWFALALFLATGCTESTTFWGDPDRLPATKSNMRNYVSDSYDCVQNSAQEIRLGQLPSSKQRDAQRLYEECMTARGYQILKRQ